MQCKHCEKLQENSDLIFETECWKIFLAHQQAYLGRCKVTLKRHCGCLSELTQKEWIDFSEVAKKLEFSLKKSFGAIMFNWTCLMNNAYLVSNTDPHMHWHFRPRYDKKVEFCDIVFDDPDFAHHYDRTRKKEILQEVRDNIIEKIKENM